jgi:hypothetical protein
MQRTENTSLYISSFGMSVNAVWNGAALWLLWDGNLFLSVIDGRPQIWRFALKCSENEVNKK